MKIKDNVLIVTSIAEDVSGIEAIKSEFEKNHKDYNVCIGRLREDTLFDYKFACMSHNTLRGAAGGGVLLAELLAAKGYFD